MIAAKSIKPKRFDAGVIQKELQIEVNACGREIKADFEKTTKPWTHKVKFEVLRKYSGGELSVIVGTDDEIYRFVDQGTKRHPIPKGGPGLLAFRPNYTAKTSPRIIGSQPGGASGNRIVRFKQVMHPGTKAREFDKMIQAMWKSRFKSRMETALSRGVAKCGHKA